MSSIRQEQRIRVFASVRSLTETRFEDAASLYGQSIPALLLIDGWHTRRLLVLFGISVLSSLCVTALATAIGRSLNTRLTAGSYAFGILALVISALTLFSAIL